MTFDGQPDVPAESRVSAIDWHPDAIHPPFEWSVKLPQDWAVLQTHPATWERQVNRIVDDQFAGQRLPSKVRKELVKSLSAAVAMAQKKKVLLTLVRVGVNDETRRPETIAFHLMWSSSSPRLASMAPIRKAVASSKGSVEELTTPTGHAFALTTATTVDKSGPESTEVLTVQSFYPLPTTAWTLVLSASTSRLDLADPIKDMVIRCVGSVRRTSDDGAARPPEDLATVGGDPQVFEHAFNLIGATFPAN